MQPAYGDFISAVCRGCNQQVTNVLKPTEALPISPFKRAAVVVPSFSFLLEAGGEELIDPGTTYPVDVLAQKDWQ